MKRHLLTILILCSALYFGAPFPARAQWSLDFETGLVSSGYNDIRIPGDTGTKFSLSRDLDADGGLFYRVRLGYDINPRHRLSLLLAPLELRASGTFGKSIFFVDKMFAAGSQIQALYRFNSYRLTYSYRWVDGRKFKLDLGLTAKIRDALIRLESGGAGAEKKNVGFVPLINFRLEWKIGKRTMLLAEGDALAAPQGRAEDVFLGLLWGPSEKLQFKAGGRIVEGGADNDKVYTFALIKYLCAGLVIRL